jgi:hypothetical protein
MSPLFREKNFCKKDKRESFPLFFFFVCDDDEKQHEILFIPFFHVELFSLFSSFCVGDFLFN